MTERQEKELVAELMDSMKLPESQERTARRYIGRAVDKILIYCNREDLPDRLMNTVVQIAEDMMRSDRIVEEEKEVAGITRGDTAISYHTGNENRQAAIDFMKNYEKTLNHFKKMNLPKEKRDD